MSYLEQICLKNCPYEFKPVIYKGYVDDTLLFFRSKDHIKKFRCYLNCQRPNIKFTSEIEQSIPYRFSILELEGLTIVFLQVFIVK